MLKAGQLPLLVLILAAFGLDAHAQGRFEAPVGPRSWSPTEWAERWRFDGPNGLLEGRDGAGAPRGMTGIDPALTRDTVGDDARQRAFDAAEIDPGILIFPETPVDTSMVIPVPDLVDPHMILPPEEPRDPKGHDSGAPSRR